MEIRRDTTYHDAPVDILPVHSGEVFTVQVPGSKSYTLRALFLGVMTPGRVIIENALESDDTVAAIRCLRTLGLQIAQQGSHIEITNDISAVQDKTYELDVNQSGVTLRFLTALCCLLPGTQTIYGTASLNERPIDPLVDALIQLGADIAYIGTSGHPPLTVASSTLHGNVASIDGSMSSQYISAILQIAPLLANGLTLNINGILASAPYAAMTIDTMKHFGVSVANDHNKVFSVDHKQRYQLDHYKVEGDMSSAAYFFAIATIARSTVTVTRVNPHSKQADMALLDILEQMGASIKKGLQDITVTGHGVRALDIDMEQCPDQVMTIAVLAAYARGTTTIRGIRTLRVKETDRVAAIENELSKLGITTSSTEDTLVIHGGTPHAADIETYHDHRIAMALSIAGTVTPGIHITNPRVVEKTFPSYWHELSKLSQPSPRSLVSARLLRHTGLARGVAYGRQ